MPQISNATIVGAQPVVGDIGVLLREGTAGMFWNFVVDGFGDACLDLDDAATFDQANAVTPASGDLTIESMFLDCSGASSVFDEESADPFDISTWFNAQSNNTVGESSLQGPLRTINGPAEAAVTATDPSAVDPFFDSVDFVGAIENAENDWTVGWTFGLQGDPGCPDSANVTEAGDGTCIISGTVTSDLRLQAGRDYLLRGSVFIGEPANADGTGGTSAALTIDAGVTVEAEDTDALLVITRGSDIFVNGTQNAPVVMTAINDETRNILTDTSLWGGLAINGLAPLNSCSSGICESQGEGDTGPYGGNNPADSSGRINYLVVKYAGNIITGEDELNAVAFQGVGSGTEVNYLQAHNGADDGIEFYGGTVNAKYLVVTGADDDSIDWTEGWQGKVQYALVVQNPNQPNSDQGIEADNLDDANDALPRSAPLMSNVTLIGAQPVVGDIGMLLREGTAGRYWNFVIDQFGDACFDIDDAATFDQADAQTPANGDLTLQSALFDCSDAASVFSEESGDAFDLSDWFDAQSNNTVGESSLQARSTGGVAFINGANEAAVTATDPSAVDPFFDSVDFIGAVESEANDWTAGWTVFLDQQF